MKPKGRPLRVAALIKEEIAKLLTKGLKDPRIGFVSVMDVRMSKDLRYANVYVSLFGEAAERKSSLVGLQHSAGWIRHEVGKYLHIRVIPEIRFFPDDTLDKVYHLEEVFEEIHAEQQQQPMLQLSLGEVVDLLREGNIFYLVCHENPDGDAVGAMLALRFMLQAMGKANISCAAADPIPRIYQDLPGAKTVVNADAEPPNFDLAVLLDCGRRDRVGAIADYLAPGKRLLIIDHHLEPGEPGASGLVDPSYASTGEIVAELFDAAAIPVSQDAALCLYAAVATDTGGFRFSNTTARTHHIAARLLETGIDVHLWNNRFFSDMNRKKFELMRRALSRVEFHAGCRVALSWITSGDLEDLEARQEEVENLVNYWQNVDTVSVAIIFKSFDPNTTKVSFRSDASFDSAAFLRQFGGGGHAPAAGATLDMPLEQAKDTVLKALLDELRSGE
ncbi:MAG TPA: 30S ribosome-binding factor RbfA [Candidatus Hydrogenedentes bacterium]|nr:30S ribosome-binding factor RbfA [Candidatus Hydrogenedentota bacterium]